MNRRFDLTAGSILSNILRVILAYTLSKSFLGIAGVFRGVNHFTDTRVLWIPPWAFLKRKEFSCNLEAA